MVLSCKVGIWGDVFQNDVCVLKQCSVYVVISPVARFHGSRDHGVEMGFPVLTPSDPLLKFLLLSPMDLGSVGQ